MGTWAAQCTFPAPMPNPKQWAASRARQKLYAALRGCFASRGFDEVETPTLVPAPGMEPHITAFEVPFVPETDVGPKRDALSAHQPRVRDEAAARGRCRAASSRSARCSATARSRATHNPEFTMLEFYRPHADYHAIMADLGGALAAAGARRWAAEQALFARTPFERLTVRDAVLRETGIDLRRTRGRGLAQRAAEAPACAWASATSFDDVFFHLFLQKVEPKLGRERPTFLIEYPASMASLARLKPGDPTVAERFELYARGAGAGERLLRADRRGGAAPRLEERAGARAEGPADVYPLDERVPRGGGPHAALGGCRRGAGPGARCCWSGPTHRRGVALFLPMGFL